MCAQTAKSTDLDYLSFNACLYGLRNYRKALKDALAVKEE